MFIVQGEGRGHLTQAIRLKEILEENGHELTAVFFGINPQRAFPEYIMDEFSCELFFFNSPNFIFKPNRKGINLTSSLLYNIWRIPIYINSILKIRRQIHEQSPDVIINFYDTIGGLAFYFSNRKSAFFAISHQFLFEHPEFPEPRGYKLQKKFLILHNNIASLQARARIALSFTPLQDFGRNRILPPLIRKEIMDVVPGNENLILVYLLNEGLVADLLDIFKTHREMSFKLYVGAERLSMKLPSNVHLQELNYQKFADSMTNCSGIITTAGFESVCEAAYLGKTIFLIPSENHYEQHGNLEDARRAGIAESYRSFQKKKMNPENYQDFRDWSLKAKDLFYDLLIP